MSEEKESSLNTLETSFFKVIVKRLEEYGMDLWTKEEEKVKKESAEYQIGYIEAMNRCRRLFVSALSDINKELEKIK
jgi:hypothetical protein